MAIAGAVDVVEWRCCRFRARAGDGVAIAGGGRSTVYGRRSECSCSISLVEEDVDGGRVGENYEFRVGHVGAVVDAVVANERASILT